MRSFDGFNRLTRRALSRVLFGTTLLAAGFVHAADGHWLFIEFDPDRVRYAIDGVNDPDLQPFQAASSSDCTLTSSGAAYLVFTGSPGGAGFKNGSNLIGLKGGSGGTPCGRVRDGETLTIAVGGEFPDRQMKLANLRYAYRNNTRVRVELVDAGTVVDRFEIRSGNYRSGTPLSPVPPTHAINCSSSPCLVTLQSAGQKWDQIRLTTTLNPGQPGNAGEWSIGEGTSSIQLTDFVPEGELACGDEAEETEGTTATIRRLPDVDGECGPLLPYALTFDGNTVEFLADYSVLEPGDEAAFEWKVTWDPEAVALTEGGAVIYNPGENPVLGERVPLSDQYFLDSDPVYTVDLCAGTAVYAPIDPAPEQPPFEELQELVLVPDSEHPENPYGRYDMSALPGIQYGCWLNKTYVVLPPADCGISGDDELCVQVIEEGYVRGDWTSTRTLR